LENGSTWIGLLSRLDQLSALKHKDEKKFWNNPKWTTEYESYLQVSESLSNSLTEIYGLEAQSLGYLREQQDLSFEDLLIKLDSMVHHEHNRAVVSFFGPTAAINTLERHYRDWLEALDINFSILHHYLETTTGDDDDVPEPNKTVAHDKSSSDAIKQQGEAGRYISQSKPSTKPSHRLIGKAYVVQGPAVAHYFALEKGVWKLEDSSQEFLLYVSPHIGKTEELTIPDGVHRKQFFKNLKPRRFVTENHYRDEQIDAKASLRLANHANVMRTARIQRLKHIHLPEDETKPSEPDQ